VLVLVVDEPTSKGLLRSTPCAIGLLVPQATARVREFAQKHCTIAVPGRQEFRRAADLASNDAWKLRAGDALHLAIAGSLNAQGILCLDEAMIESAKSLGLRVVTV